MLSIGNAFRYQYDAGAAMDTDFSGPSFCFRVVRNLRYAAPSPFWPIACPLAKISGAYISKRRVSYKSWQEYLEI